MTETSTGPQAPQTEETKRSEPDPTLPQDQLPRERAGTEDSVRAEMEGVSRFQGFAEIDRLKKANKLKNRGVRFQLPRHTLQPPPIIRLRPLTHGALSVAQGQHRKDVRQQLGLKGNAPMPTRGTMELHRRLILQSLVEWCEGETDIDGAVTANKIKNAGIRYRFPRTMLPGVVLRLRPLSHFYVQLARAKADQRIRRSLGLRHDEDLPPEANLELQRAMIEATILEWCDGDVLMGGERFNLIGEDRWTVRAWFRDNFLPPANLRDKPPRDEAERDEFFETMFEDLNNDFLEELGMGLDQIRTADPAELLASPETFTVGADWEPDPKATYEPKQLVSWAEVDSRELQRLFADAFFPPIDLKSKAPPGDAQTEEFWEARFAGFHNELLNELLFGQDLIKEADAEDVLAKGTGFTVGAPATTGSSD